MHQVKKTLKLIRVSVLEGEEVNNLKENVDYLSFQRYSWRLDLMPRTKMVQPFYTHVHNPAITVLLLGFIKPGLDEAQLNPGGFSFLCASGVFFFFSSGIFTDRQCQYHLFHFGVHRQRKRSWPAFFVSRKQDIYPQHKSTVKQSLL